MKLQSDANDGARLLPAGASDADGCHDDNDMHVRAGAREKYAATDPFSELLFHCALVSLSAETGCAWESLRKHGWIGCHMPHIDI